jgi:hypothetical protein
MCAFVGSQLLSVWVVRRNGAVSEFAINRSHRSKSLVEAAYFTCLLPEMATASKRPMPGHCRIHLDLIAAFWFHPCRF